MKKLLQINPVLRTSTSTAKIMQEIGELAMQNGWESYIAYSNGRDGIRECTSKIVPVGSKASVAWHGVMTRIFDRHGLASSQATRKFIKEIERISPDVIHIHNIHGYFLNYQILFDFLSASGIPVVWTVHDCWLYTGHCYYYTFAGCDKWKNGCGSCPQKRLFPSSLLFDRSAKNFKDKQKAFCSMPADKLTVVPVSNWIKGEMESSFLRNYNYQLIHNGINTDIFAPADKDKKESIRDLYGLGNKTVIMGIASIWSTEKGLDDFLKISQMLKDNEVIVLVGVSAELKKRLPTNIIGISRTENASQLAQLYSASDVFANPTWQDNYPTVNLEAISCGTPVVTYRTGGSIESITEETGKIVDRGDVQAMLAAARELAAEGKDRHETSCRNFSLKHFRKEDRYKDYLNLYERLITSRR